MEIDFKISQIYILSFYSILILTLSVLIIRSIKRLPPNHILEKKFLWLSIINFILSTFYSILYLYQTYIEWNNVQGKDLNNLYKFKNFLLNSDIIPRAWNSARRDPVSYWWTLQSNLWTIVWSLYLGIEGRRVFFYSKRVWLRKYINKSKFINSLPTSTKNLIILLDYYIERLTPVFIMILAQILSISVFTNLLFSLTAEDLHYEQRGRKRFITRSNAMSMPPPFENNRSSSRTRTRNRSVSSTPSLTMSNSTESSTSRSYDSSPIIISSPGVTTRSGSIRRRRLLTTTNNLQRRRNSGSNSPRRPRIPNRPRRESFNEGSDVITLDFLNLNLIEEFLNKYIPDWKDYWYKFLFSITPLIVIAPYIIFNIKEFSWKLFLLINITNLAPILFFLPTPSDSMYGPLCFLTFILNINAFSYTSINNILIFTRVALFGPPSSTRYALLRFIIDDFFIFIGVIYWTYVKHRDDDNPQHHVYNTIFFSILGGLGLAGLSLLE